MLDDETGAGKKVFGAIMSAPNPTGPLHLGHALNLSIEDVLCRWHRDVKGHEVFWAAGIDHGCCSTEYVAEKQLRMQGAYPEHLSSGEKRSAVESWVEQTIPVILGQMRAFNLIADLTETRRMHDSERQAQFDAIVDELAASGVMYKRRAVVRWCSTRRTTVDTPDIVVEERPVEEFSVRYVADDSRQTCLDVWLRDPATLVNDLALVVPSSHPAAECGARSVTNPLGKSIPFVVNDPAGAAASGTGTGAWRVVPGHCERSFAWAMQRGHAATRAFDESNVMEDVDYRGMTRAEAADAILRKIRARGGLRETRVTSASREVFRLSDSPVEYLLTDQCFIGTRQLAEKVLALLADGQVRVFPETSRSMLIALLRGLSEAPAGSRLGERYGEWCVSQQTVWGNYLRSGRIRWCNDDPGFAGADTEIANMRLSSAVWSFCANRVFGLGSDDLARLSSNTVLVAGADNLLFWILPTLFLSVVVRSGPPVKDVVVHPLILDEQGRKMSKSLGNVVSPDAILERHGADALRLSVLWRLDLQEPSLRFRAADVDAASALIADLRAALCSLKSRFPVEVAATRDADCRLLYRRMDDALARYDFANAMNGVKEAAARLLEAAAGGSRGERYRDYLRLLAPFMPALAAEFLNERELQRSAGAA